MNLFHAIQKCICHDYRSVFKYNNTKLSNREGRGGEASLRQRACLAMRMTWAQSLAPQKKKKAFSQSVISQRCSRGIKIS